jgi:hypothetical protein
MSTPCIVTAKKNPSVALYIHYDGYDKEMVEKIVAIAKNNHARNVNDDESYGMARLICAAQEYFKNETTGFGVCTMANTDGHDYHWVINEDWSVEEA